MNEITSELTDDVEERGAEKKSRVVTRESAEKCGLQLLTLKQCKIFYINPPHLGCQIYGWVHYVAQTMDQKKESSPKNEEGEEGGHTCFLIHSLTLKPS
jgi:hypothetical protein